MRLTLRTLLAYLDDRLPPANAREIGQKIANSPFTTDLVERIREVKRRRRLADPGRTQPMIEPNLIAEYLDDQLTPDLVARVEREILASDAMLAEVASAHEILGLLRDPVAVEPRLRDRLYGLDPSGKTSLVRALNPEASTAGNAAESTSTWKPLTVPKPSSKRLPAIIAAVLAIVWLAVLISDSTFVGPKKTEPVAEPVAAQDAVVAMDDVRADKAGGDMEPAKADQEAAADDKAGDVDVAKNDIPQVKNGAGEKMAPPPAVNAVEVPAETGSKQTSAIVAANDNPTVAGKPPATEKPMAEKPATDPSAASATTPPVPSNPIEVPVITEPEIPVSYYLQADSRSLLVRHESMHRWQTFSSIPGGDALVNAPNDVNCGPIMGPSWFGVTERFPLIVTTGAKGYTAELHGPCLVRMQRGAAGGLDFLAGRLKLSATQSVAWNDEIRPEFNLGVGRTNTLLTLGSADTRLALEVTPLMPISQESSSADAESTNELADSFLQIDSDLQVEMTVLEGSIQLSNSEEPDSIELKQNQRAIWTVAGLRDSSRIVVDNGEAVSALPAWYFDSSSEPLPEVGKQNLRLLELLANNAEPGDCVQPLLDERNPQYGVLAVQVLSLTRDTDRLLSVLFATKDESIHRAAIDGLSLIANSSSAGRKDILLGVETRMPKAEATPLVQLIKGLSPSQASDPTVVVDLMAMLGSERLVVRTVAIYRMEQIAGDRKGYHPEADSSRRRDAIRRWQRTIDQNAGKLVP
ncbi:MAG: hypothetical protein U0936_06785 [Planctomycetaceae bacterium]